MTTVDDPWTVRTTPAAAEPAENMPAGIPPTADAIALDDRLWHAYLAGRTHGYDQGYTDAQHDHDQADQQAWDLMRAALHATATHPTWADLCALRGEPTDVIARNRAALGWQPLHQPPAGQGAPL